MRFLLISLWACQRICLTVELLNRERLNDLLGRAMWTYTIYILYKYFEKHSERSELNFSELANFIFNELWKKQRLVFHDGRDDLRQDLRYLHKLGMIQLEDNEDFARIKIKVSDKEKLKRAANIVENSADLTGVKLFSDYKQRIKKALQTEVIR